jgi:Alginate export
MKMRVRPRLVRLAFMLFSVSLTGRAAWAQAGCSPTAPPGLLPSEENYSNLSDPSQRTNLIGELHYIPLDDQEGSHLSFGGEAREWSEFYSRPDFGEGPDVPNGYLLQRYLGWADLHLESRFRLFGELGSYLEDGRIGGPRPQIDEARMMVQQAFVDVSLHQSEHSSLTLRVGRQEMELGSGRFVDVREGPNVRQSFEGVKLTGCTAGWRVDLFALKPINDLPDFFASRPLYHTSFWGGYATHATPIIAGSHIDLYYFGFRQVDSVYNQGVGRELRETFGSRLFGERGQWDYDNEAAYQFGSFGAGAIRAWTADTNTGYRVRGWKWKPHFTLRTDAASGDKNPKSMNLETFNPLFPILRFSPGQEGTIAPANLLDVHPMVDLNLQRNVQVTFDSDFLWRESLYDGIYLPGPSLVVSGLNNRARYIGDKNGVEIDWSITHHVSYSIYYSNLQGGPFVRQSHLARDVNYVATWIVLTL